MSHLFFVSYARANTKREADRELLAKFVEELTSEVDQFLGGSSEEICFFDRTDIEAGSTWTSRPTCGSNAPTFRRAAFRVD